MNIDPVLFFIVGEFIILSFLVGMSIYIKKNS